ncbi:TonB-dependent receptor domain-containing protein [Novosphingobium sp. M1R2S20]|uniref:TonB-dependent receptor n=1 Tax=Novosphingobium rhizovicinum TaxID=3228928 RepID=A0ABV3RGP0_9SPHN
MMPVWPRRSTISTVLLMPLLAAAQPSYASARETEVVTVHLPEQPLGESLKALALLSGRNVLADEAVISGKDAPALEGRYTLKRALERLLAGSGLLAQPIEGGFVVRAQGASSSLDTASDEILVTGSRIRGAPVASPTVVLDQQALRDTGHPDLGAIARSLPQSFGGGQNPGIGLNVPQSAGQNIGGSSSVNLRGLGSDATLTVLNGRRLPYDGVFQGTDISAIPIDAVARVEVVADGSSAIYGSDAVAGVVNVILRDDYQGFTTRARLGSATSGGDFQQVYGAIGGDRWNGGGAFIAYEFNRNTEVNSSDRSSTRIRPHLTLLPRQRRHAVTGHIHQDVVTDLTVEVDALYNTRDSGYGYPLNAQSDPDVSRAEQDSRAYSFALAGSAKLVLGPWRLSASTTFGRGRTRLAADYFFDGVLSSSFSSLYKNRTFSSELALEGPLFSLPGGPARIAAGLGLRNTHFISFLGDGNIQNIDTDQKSRYAFSEISLPLIAPNNRVPLIYKLDLSAALRYEDYRDVGDIATPKLGLVYALNDTIELRGSWGRSFRAPSFYDLFGVQQASLYPISRFSSAGYPASATALILTGGNPSLKPERARSWSATLALHPPAFEGASLEVSYFATRYSDRVVAPITVIAQALTNPAYASQITNDPTAAQSAAAIANAQYFENYSNAGYDPSTVAALIDGRNTNVGQQTIEGVDVQARYRTRVAGGAASFHLNASYLKSEQRIVPEAPAEQLAGRLFSPAHWRGRAGGAWDDGVLRLTATLSYISGITDVRLATPDHVRGMTTLDLGLQYRLARQGILAGTEVAITVENALNAMPADIATTYYYDTPYDSTNYSAVGRVVSFEVRKSW